MGCRCRRSSSSPLSPRLLLSRCRWLGGTDARRFAAKIPVPPHGSPLGFPARCAGRFAAPVVTSLCAVRLERSIGAASGPGPTDWHESRCAAPTRLTPVLCPPPPCRCSHSSMLARSIGAASGAGPKDGHESRHTSHARSRSCPCQLSCRFSNSSMTVYSIFLQIGSSQPRVVRTVAAWSAARPAKLTSRTAPPWRSGEAYQYSAKEFMHLCTLCPNLSPASPARSPRLCVAPTGRLRCSFAVIAAEIASNSCCHSSGCWRTNHSTLRPRKTVESPVRNTHSYHPGGGRVGVLASQAFHVSMITCRHMVISSTVGTGAARASCWRAASRASILSRSPSS